MDINLLQHAPLLISGIITTLELMLCGLAVGLLFALFLTFCSYMHSKAINALINSYVFFIRGTPLLIQFFLIYYGSSQISFINESFLWEIFKQPFACAVMALAINTSAYSVELFRGAIASIPKGEIEACYALGMTKLHMLKKIIVPRAVRFVLPSYSNEVLIILKSTTLASTITLMDLMGVTKRLISETYATIPFLLLAGVIYLVISLLIIQSFKMMELSLQRKI